MSMHSGTQLISIDSHTMTLYELVLGADPQLRQLFIHLSPGCTMQSHKGTITATWTDDGGTVILHLADAVDHPMDDISSDDAGDEVQVRLLL